MSKIIFSIALLFISISFAAAKSNNNLEANTTETKALKGSKLFLNYQAFISHDKMGTQIDTVSNAGDYIEFGENGIAYMFYKGRIDSLNYYFTDNNEISFGDTPFEIKSLGNGYYTLYQKEVEKNGNYNSVTYNLKKDNHNLSFKTK
jgi:hypothetical protein